MMISIRVEGYLDLISVATSSTRVGVREARMRREGACEAMAVAVVEPMLFGLIPVIRTVGEASVSRCYLFWESRGCHYTGLATNLTFKHFSYF